jgi:hypothetical protein
MKKVSLFVLALIVTASMALALVPNTKMEKDGIAGSKAAPITITQGKDAGDLIINGVHDFSCYMTAARCIDMDPAFGTGTAVLFLRGTDLFMHYVGTIDGGASWSTMGPLTASIRYPSAMCDRILQKPVAFYNWGWGAAGEGAYTLWDDGNYNDGLWGSETELDTLGRGVAGTAYYCVNGTMGSNGVYHVLANYWGDFTPDASFYYRSTDNGATWSGQDPRSLNNMHYDLFGTEDSLNIFKSGVVHDPIVEGYVNQVQIVTSLDGNTVMVGSCGLTPDTLGNVLLWYRMSTDAGLTWSPLTWAPDQGSISWEAESYDLGIAIDKDGYPHFATYLALDTLDDGSDYGPLSGIYDYHNTASGWVLTQVSGAIDSTSGGTPTSVYPDFCNFALDAYGDLVLTFGSSLDGDPADIYITRSVDNGASYGAPMKITDGTQACWYPHIPFVVGDSSSSVPVYYQVANDGYVHWVPLASIPTGVAGAPAPRPVHGFALNRNYPNPVNGKTNISFSLPKAGDYSLKVYNVAGQVVNTINGRGNAGINTVNWNSKNVSNGVYFYQLNAAGNTATRKMIVVK